VEASAFPAPASLARTRISIGAPLLRLRSDEQLVASFRDGNNEAFRVIYDRYRQRLFAYTRQMLPGSRQDAEDALQDVFVRAFGGLRANDRELALRAWLYRIAHNRCIDELRRPAPPAPELMELVRPPVHDPIAEAEQREALRRLIADVRRLPGQQRSALLMRELAGMSYLEIADALAISVAAVKSLLVRARVGLAQSAEARDTSCSEVREDLIVAHDRGVRPTGMARRHLRDCAGCREFRGHLRGTSRQFAALLPALGPLGVLAKLLGFGGGAGGSAAASAGAGAAARAAGTGGTIASVGAFATGAGHVATILAAAVVTAGGAVEIQHSITPVAHHSHHRTVASSKPVRPASTPAYHASQTSAPIIYAGPAPTQPVQAAVVSPDTDPTAAPTPVRSHQPTTKTGKATTPSTASLGGFADMQPVKATGGTKTGSESSGTGEAGGSTTATSANQPPATTGTGTGTVGTSTPAAAGATGSSDPTTGGTGTTGSDGSQGTTTGSGGTGDGSGGTGSGSGGSTPVGTSAS
jgi:RNA polymerase sigma factor (sigma-70 family)